MTLKKYLNKTWLAVFIALLIGLAVGASIARWHYMRLYKGYILPQPCSGSVTFLDKTGKKTLYTMYGCAQ